MIFAFNPNWIVGQVKKIDVEYVMKWSLDHLNLFHAKCHYNIVVDWCIYTPVNYANIGSHKGLLPVSCKAITWTNDGLLLIGPLGTNICDICLDIQIVSLKKMHLKMSFAKHWPFCLGSNVFKSWYVTSWHKFIKQLIFTGLTTTYHILSSLVQNQIW